MNLQSPAGPTNQKPTNYPDLSTRPVTRVQTLQIDTETGEKLGVSPKIDWIRMTGSEVVTKQLARWIESHHLDDHTGEPEPTESRNGLFGYQYGRYWEGTKGPKLCWGAKSETVMIDLPGSWLSRFDLLDQVQILDDLFYRGMSRVTRLDLALDYTEIRGRPFTLLDDAIYEIENFQTLVRPTTSKIIDGRKNHESSGKTLYLGSPTSEAYIRIYDKGMQTGTLSQNQWIRWEVEFKDSKALEAASLLTESSPDHLPVLVQSLCLGAVQVEPVPAWLLALINGQGVTVLTTKTDVGDLETWKADFAKKSRTLREMAFQAGMSVPGLLDSLFQHGELSPLKPKSITPILREVSKALT